MKTGGALRLRGEIDEAVGTGELRQGGLLRGAGGRRAAGQRVAGDGPDPQPDAAAPLPRAPAAAVQVVPPADVEELLPVPQAVQVEVEQGQPPLVLVDDDS